MEAKNNTELNSAEKTKETPKETPKLVNLFEDMKHHEHDQVSYDEMKKVPENSYKR
jgi:hypothetical protein